MAIFFFFSLLSWKCILLVLPYHFNYFVLRSLWLYSVTRHNFHLASSLQLSQTWIWLVLKAIREWQATVKYAFRHYPMLVPDHQLCHHMPQFIWIIPTLPLLLVTYNIYCKSIPHKYDFQILLCCTLLKNEHNMIHWP